MENREQQILSEIKSMMASIRSQLEILDAKMAELQQAVDPEEFEAESIDIDIDVEETVEIPAVEEVVVQEIPLEEEDEVLAEDLPEEIVEKEEQVVDDDDLPEAVEERQEAVVPEADDDLPGVFDEPEPVVAAPRARHSVKQTVNESMASECAWLRDMPGAPVRDIRSAISLNDRVIFINLLFNEDAQAFVNALTAINTMTSLDQVVEYVSAEFPSWDMNSELVYRFMMAVRRKVK